MQTLLLIEAKGDVRGDEAVNNVLEELLKPTDIADETEEYARILRESGHGIALRKPTCDVDVSDLCYWSPEGEAARVFNIFDNKQVCIRTCGS
jgi:aspartokinase